MMKRRHFLAAGASPLVFSLPALAQTDYPNKPVRMLVGYAPGGATDLLARQLAQRLTPLLKQTVIVENRPGASGNIATEMTARALPDGYTLMMGAAAQIATNPSLYRNLRANPLTELAPITQLQVEHNVLVVNSAVPVHTFAEFVAYAQKNRGRLAFSSAGPGSPGHLAFEMVNARDELKMSHVPYKGSAPSVNDVVAGHITATIDSMVVLLPHVRSGKLRALAVLSEKRAAAAPEIPVASAIGRPDFVFTSWKGLFAPRGTPDILLTRIYRACAQILTDRELREQLIAAGAEPLGSDPAQFAASIKVEAAKWAEVVKLAGVTLE